MNNDQYLKKAKNTVADETGIAEEDLYIVWFCKTLQNWKALVSTDIDEGNYWEVTYNGDKKETYFDAYVKVANVAISD